MEFLPPFSTILILGAAVAGYCWCVSWAIGDAQRRNQGGGLIVLLFCLLGPLAALVWLLIRPTQVLAQKSPMDYVDAEDAIAASARLQSLGDWDAAVTLFRSIEERWPERSAYGKNASMKFRGNKRLPSKFSASTRNLD